MAIVYIPSQWRDLTGGVDRVEIVAANVRQIIAALERQFPGIAARAVAGDALAPGIAVSLDGSLASRLLTPVDARSEIHFLPALSGG
ncbi:MAG TPA: MoaD/ThiS family protein [Pirellulales bacterium]|jgi:molybdopterin converting factor small subunit|nr:MoaD/ThiS family protein [Pirellulales bacterium]